MSEPATLASAIEAEAAAAAEAVRARRRVDALLAEYAVVIPSLPPTTEHMTRIAYARSRGVSPATVTRLLAEGMPSIPVGSSVRIVAADADEWRRGRGRAPTTPVKRAVADDVDVASLVRASGLRAVAGARQ